MLNQQTIEKLHLMRMRGMADAFTQQQEDLQTAQLSFEERFGLLVDRQWNWRQNRALERRLRDARLQGQDALRPGHERYHHMAVEVLQRNRDGGEAERELRIEDQ